MAKQRITWTLEDHLCRECHGRVLRSASGVGATGGGNPLYRCADCGICASATGPHAICWCGFEHRRAATGAHPYQCRPLADAKDNPAIRVAFQACGYDPERSKSEIGVLMPEHLRLAEERIARARGDLTMTGDTTPPDAAAMLQDADDADLHASMTGELPEREVRKLAAHVRALVAEVVRLDSIRRKFPWYRDGVGPDVPVLQDRYDALRTDRDRLAAENERLKETVLGRLSRHVVVGWVEKITAELVRRADEVDRQNNDAESPYRYREHYGRSQGLREAAALLREKVGPDPEDVTAAGERDRLAAEVDRLRAVAGLMADPVINRAVNDHIAERYKTIKPDSCGSCAHKLYETGDCVTGDHVVVEWHDKSVWFSPDGGGVEVEEYPNRQTALAAENAALRAALKPFADYGRVLGGESGEAVRAIGGDDFRRAAALLADKPA